jgi:hypothetical protein
MTVTSSLTHDTFGNKIWYSALQTVTSNDTTDPINTPAINITGMDIAAMAFGYTATSAAANSTTAQLLLQGSVDNGTTWMTLKDTSAADIATSAATIGAATPTVPVGRFVSTADKSISQFPLTHVRGQLDQAGSSVGFTGTIQAAFTTRTKYNT